MCLTAMSGSPPRSATVRATLRMRSWARALRPGRGRSSGGEQAARSSQRKPKLGNSSYQWMRNRGWSLLQSMTLSSRIRPDLPLDRMIANRKFHAPCCAPTDVIQDTALFPLRRKIRCGMEMRLSLLTPGKSARLPRSWASAAPSQAEFVSKLVRGKLLRRAEGGAVGRPCIVSLDEAGVRHLSPEALPSQGGQVQGMPVRAAQGQEQSEDSWQLS